MIIDQLPSDAHRNKLKPLYLWSELNGDDEFKKRHRGGSPGWPPGSVVTRRARRQLNCGRCSVMWDVAAGDRRLSDRIHQRNHWSRRLQPLLSHTALCKHTHLQSKHTEVFTQHTLTCPNKTKKKLKVCLSSLLCRRIQHTAFCCWRDDWAVSFCPNQSGLFTLRPH